MAALGTARWRRDAAGSGGEVLATAPGIRGIAGLSLYRQYAVSPTVSFVVRASLTETT
jgi:hypothetical protein